MGWMGAFHAFTEMVGPAYVAGHSWYGFLRLWASVRNLPHVHASAFFVVAFPSSWLCSIQFVCNALLVVHISFGMDHKTATFKIRWIKGAPESISYFLRNDSRGIRYRWFLGIAGNYTQNTDIRLYSMVVAYMYMVTGPLSL